jgi:hypothetical protein
MPIRTINDAAFFYTDDKGITIHARRGDTVDIPEGYDLTRGEKAGSFTIDGGEPKPNPDTFMPDISLAWDTAEYRAFVDDATADEIKAKFGELDDEAKPAVAAQLIAAEQSRGKKVRKSIIDGLSGYVTDAPVTEDDAEILDDGDDAVVAAPKSKATK